MEVTLVSNVVVRHSLGEMRREYTPPEAFRQHFDRIAPFLLATALDGLRMKNHEIKTPLGLMTVPTMNQPILFVSVMRAGLWFDHSALEMVPNATICHVGVRRIPDTLQPEVYLNRLAAGYKDYYCVVMDPMLATGGTAEKTVELAKDVGIETIRFMCLLAVPEGIKCMKAAHPDVPIITAAVDSHLNNHGYIMPGLGDAGDRMFGTK